MCVNLGDSDDSLSGSDVDEQDLWEETQIEKGVKRRPGEQVKIFDIFLLSFFCVSLFLYLSGIRVYITKHSRLP